MHIKKIIIENFRGIRKMELELHPKLNVFIGTNGAGKSSVLDIIAMIFSRSPIFSDGNVLSINYKDIRKGADCIFAGLYCDVFNREYRLNICYSETNQTSDTAPASENIVAQQKRKIIDDNDVSLNFPLVVYYPANRLLGDVPERIRGFRPVINQLDALDRALGNELDFHSFFGKLRECFHSSNENEIYQDSFSKRFCSQKKAIQNALICIFDNFSSLRVEQNSFQIIIDKDGNSLELSQLSDGEKSLIALVSDLAQRLSIANPTLENPLEGEGVILIDEIDLHLHPQWQRMILPKLTETFPNCQFIVSTHSPQILGEIRSENVIVLTDSKDGIEWHVPAYEIYGQTSDVLLEDMMKTPERDFSIKEKISTISAALEHGDLENAKQYLNELRQQAVDIPELIRLDLRLSRKEIVGK